MMVAEHATAQTIRKNSPGTNDVLATVPITAIADVPKLVERARLAQQVWAQTPVRQRGKALVRLAQVMAERAESLGDLIAAETGKPIFEALMHEIFPVVDLSRYFGKRLHKILARKPISLHLLKHRRSYIHYVPRGVVGVIGPWNFPFTLIMGDIVMALGAGNAVVLKPSEHTPLIALEVPKLLDAAGIDPELVQVTIGYGDVGQAVIEAGVNMVHFTGSGATGRKIAKACGERLIPYVLELGGKDAAIVLEDANLDHAAKQIVFGAFANSGQICASMERVYAVESVYEPLVNRLVAHTEQLRQGHGRTDDIDVGPMIVANQLEIVQRHVAEAKAAGATIRTGGHASNGYFAPTILTDIDESLAICKEETFGPVLPVMPVRDVEEAISRANHSEYGLSAYIFTRNRARGRDVAERLQVGSAVVNDCFSNHAMPETPWGGMKNSGIGHTHSDDGLRHMCEARHVNDSPLPPFSAPWLFPYKKEMTGPVTEVLQGLYGKGGPLRRSRLLVGGLVRAAKAYRAHKRPK